MERTQSKGKNRKLDSVDPTLLFVGYSLSFELGYVDYNWINQLSNTTTQRLDICCLLHRYQLHVSALTAVFRLID